MIDAHLPDQPRIAFPMENAPMSLPLGAQVELGLATRKMPKAERSGALLIGVEIVGPTGAPTSVELTFDPDEPELFHASIPGFRRETADRRSTVRVFPRSGEGIRVPVRPQEDLASRPVMARLCDASAGGLGLLFPYDDEVRLCWSRVLLCEVAEPTGGRKEIECHVRNRTLQDDGVRYGVEFTAGSTGVLQPFEPLWDCPCGETGLLAASHLRCLRCGRPRSTNTRLPHRDGLLSLTAHLYTGTAKRCTGNGCAATWSSEAKFCGRCGKGL